MEATRAEIAKRFRESFASETKPYMSRIAELKSRMYPAAGTREGGVDGL